MRRPARALVLMIASLFLFAPMAAAAPSADATRVIVVLRDTAGAPPEAAGTLGRQYDFTPSLVYGHALRGFAAEVRPARLAALRADPRVAYVEIDQIVSAFDYTVPTGIQRIFAPGNGNIDIDGLDDWRVDVDVAVIDTGIDLAHPDLNVFASTNCAQTTCGSGGNDDNGHGSHVAGTIGALDNGIGVVGVAPGARLWSVKVLDRNGSGFISWIIAGIDYVTANANSIEVANMSLGCECTSAAMNTAIANSVAAGVVYAVAAGNSDKNASTFSPANHPDVITVSALADFNGASGGGASPTCRADQDDTLADFSNWGSTVEIAAPGVCILSTVPGGYATYSGTSMASPHVAGAAALLASGSSTLSPVQIRQALISNGNLNWTDDSGDGTQERLLDVSNTTVFAPTLVVSASATPAFTLSASPTSRSIRKGRSTSYALTITPSGGFTESVSLSVSGLPAGAGGTFSTNPATSSSTLSVTTISTTPTGTYTLTITGTSGSLTRTTNVTLIVRR